MARDRDIDSASASSDGQSKLRDHTSQTDSTAHHRQKNHHHQKQHHVGRHHHRVPSSKLKSNQSATRLKRAASPERESQQRPNHERRATSELKLTRNSSSGNLLKNTSQTQLTRNRSSGEVSKRNKSSDKLKRAASGSSIHKKNPSTSDKAPASKGQVHFDLGEDDVDEDEWVDASGTNSPHLSRKGSINSSAQNSLRPGFTGVPTPRSETPSTSEEPRSDQSSETRQPLPEQSAEDRQRTHHQALLTSRLLKRTASYGAPPQMTTEIAQAAPPHQSIDVAEREQEDSMSSKGGHEGLTSRFVEVTTPGLSSEGSFYHHSTEYTRTAEPEPRRIQSSVAFADLNSSRGSSTTKLDNSSLVPRSAARSAAPPAEISRTQQKLNLQRASSVIEPSQAINGTSGPVATNPWIGVGGPGFDGGTSRDPRVGRLLEKTGMEYLVVRRYVNTIHRSVNRLNRLPNSKRKIPLGSNVIVNGKRGSVDAAARHSRNVSMPDPRQTAQSRRVATIRADGAGSSFDGDDMSRLSDRMSDASLTGDEGNDVSVHLRNLWDRPVELSTSAE